MDTFLCGWLGGAAGVLASHPLDTMRVLVQTSDTTLSGATSRLWQSEGIAGFLKGLLSPLMAVGLWKAAMFSSSGATMRALKRSDDREQAPVWHSFAGGVVAGATGLSVQIPFERVKIMAQTSPPPSGVGVVAHELSLARLVWQREGAAGLYRGTLINFTLCPLAIGVWFGTNELLLRKVPLLCSIRRRRVTPGAAALPDPLAVHLVPRFANRGQSGCSTSSLAARLPARSRGPSTFPRTRPRRSCRPRRLRGRAPQTSSCSAPTCVRRAPHSFGAGLARRCCARSLRRAPRSWASRPPAAGWRG